MLNCLWLHLERFDFGILLFKGIPPSGLAPPPAPPAQDRRYYIYHVSVVSMARLTSIMMGPGKEWEVIAYLKFYAPV